MRKGKYGAKAKNPARFLSRGSSLFVMAGSSCDESFSAWTLSRFGCANVLGRPGSDRLSRGLSRSTMGAGGFNGRVRNGIGWNSSARTTRSAKNVCTIPALVGRRDLNTTLLNELCCVSGFVSRHGTCAACDQANRAISTSKLNALPRLHTWPIDEVVFLGSQAKPGFEVSFPLRCFQRLSSPYLATRLCHWRDNRSTRDTFFPVLSY